MAYKITSACVSCGSCADACPAGAISQGDDQYVIDAAACLDCGSCSDQKLADLFVVSATVRNL